jgi:uncharacterized protein
MAPTPDPVPPISVHERRVRGLRAALAAEEGSEPLRIDTHISTVLITPTRAVKLKRPVSLGFVDLSDAGRRRALCAIEVALNRRLASALYLGLAPILEGPTGVRLGELLSDHDTQALDAAGPELAVVMRAFDQASLWSNLVPAGGVGLDDARALGHTIGAFHRDRARRCPDSRYGTAERFRHQVLDNLATLRGLPTIPGELARLDTIDAAARRRDARLAPLRDARNHNGFVREGHGDLHLANIVTIEGRAVPFDCLEFDEGLRTVDVADDLAFAVMDLRHAGRPDLGWALVDGWFEATGDVDALALLDDGVAYRAMVRAKVAALSAPGSPTGADERCQRYLRTAEAADTHGPRVLVVMHGLSGSGKSVVSAVLAAVAGAVRLRSDVERKRLHGLEPTDHRGAHGAMYAASARGAIYDHLAALAARLLAGGTSVVVDASFLEHAHRARFASLAAACDARFVLVDLQVPEPLLRERLAARAARGTDPSDADAQVLALQLRTHEPLDETEQADALVLGPQLAPTPEVLGAAWRAHFERPAAVR